MSKKENSEPSIKEEIIEAHKIIIEETPETELIPINEVKHATFLRLAKPRTQKVIKSLEILGNCSNKSAYAYTEEEVLKIFNSIKEAIIETEAKFSERLVTQKELFEF